MFNGMLFHVPRSVSVPPRLRQLTEFFHEKLWMIHQLVLIAGSVGPKAKMKDSGEGDFQTCHMYNNW